MPDTTNTTGSTTSAPAQAPAAAPAPTSAPTAAPTTNNNADAPNQQSQTSGTQQGSNNNNGNNSGNNNNRPRFTGEISSLPVLLHRVETNKKDQFLTLIKRLETYLLAEFEFPSDILPALELSDPYIEFFQHRPTRQTVMTEHHLVTPLSPDDVIYLDRILKQLQEAFADRKLLLDQNNAKLFGVAWGQCSHALQEEIKLDPLYRLKTRTKSGLWLLQTLQTICSGVDRRANQYLVVYQQCQDFYRLRQYRGESIDDYYRRYKSIRDTLDILGAEVASHPHLEKLEGGAFGSIFDTQSSKAKFFAMAFLLGSDQERYGSLLTDLSNSMLQGQNNYPTTVQAAFELLGRWVGPNTTTNTNNNNNSTTSYSNNRRRRGRGGRGRGTDNSGRGGRGNIQLTQVNVDPTNLRAGHNGVTIPGAFCNEGCQHNGHTFTYCPDNPTNANRRGDFQGMNVPTISTPISSTSYKIEDILPTLQKGDLLIDTGCTGSSVCDPDLLTNIHEVVPTVSHTNNASSSFSKCGTLKRIPMKVKFDPNSLANILAMSYFWTHPDYTVFCNSSESDSIYIKTPSETLEFVFVADGLFILNNNPPNTSVNPYSPRSINLTTVADIKKQFSPQQIRRADAAKALRRRIGFPGKAQYSEILRNNRLINCPVTADDFNNALTIYGEPTNRLQGTMTRPPNNPNTRHPTVDLPPDFLTRNRKEELEVDFCFLEGETFLHSFSVGSKFTCLDHVSSRHARIYIPKVKLHKKRFVKRGFEITRIHGDSEFEPLTQNILPTIFCSRARGEHANFVERNTRSLKDKVRCIYHDTPFKRIPRVMIVSLMSVAELWSNAFPKKNGLSRELSPANIILGTPKIDYNNLDLCYGNYCQFYTSTTNTTAARSAYGIALEPLREDQKAYWFMTLPEGEKVRGWKWQILPTTQSIIDQVENLAIEQGKSEFNAYPRMELEHGVDWNDEEQVQEYYSDSDDSDYNPPNNNARNIDIELQGFDSNVSEVLEDDDDNSTVVLPQEEENTNNNNENNNNEQIDNNEEMEIHRTHDDDEQYYTESQHVQDHNSRNNNILDLINDGTNNINTLERELQQDVNNIEQHIDSIINTDDADTQYDDTTTNTNNNTNNSESTSNNNTDDSSQESQRTSDNDVDDDSQQSQQNPTHGGMSTKRSSIGLSPRLILPEAVKRLPKPNSKFIENLEIQLSQIFKDNYHNKLTQKEKERQVFNTTVNICLAQFEQMSANKGLKIYGDRAVAALIKEYRQLIDMKVFSRFKTTLLTSETRQKALRAINLIKEKRDFSVKGRCVGDGRTQRAYISKEEASSPTLSNEAFFMSLMVDLEEKRDIAIFDIPGAYLQADMPEERTTLLKFVNQYVDMVLDADPSFAPDVHYEGNTKVLYVKLDKALYGCMESGLMWYNMYTDVLKGMGFELNPYDPCVANKMINGKQCTVTFYVDDNKISHVDPEVVTSVIEALKEKFGNITVQRGKDLDFLGMIINKDGDKVTIDMRSYIKQTLELFEQHEKLTITTTSPARKTLFLTKDTDPLLPQDKSEVFHTLVAKLLWIAKRGRPDVELPVAFLCTRVHKPTDRDWRKLKRILQFLKGTINDIRKLGVSDISHMLAYIDASYAVHPDMRSHTGGLLSFGVGILLQSSRKQGLNSKSSTEAELIGLSDYVPFIVWARNFLDAQGYKPKRTTLFQDNQSTIRMAKNGRKSATGKSRHIHIRYFFVQDRINKGEFKIEYCPTDEMVSDFYTKPLQGKLYHNMRKVILGHEPISFLQDLNKRVDNVDSSHVESEASVLGKARPK